MLTSARIAFQTNRKDVFGVPRVSPSTKVSRNMAQDSSRSGVRHGASLLAMAPCTSTRISMQVARRSLIGFDNKGICHLRDTLVKEMLEKERALGECKRHGAFLRLK